MFDFFNDVDQQPEERRREKAGLCMEDPERVYRVGGGPPDPEINPAAEVSFLPLSIRAFFCFLVVSRK